MSTHLLVVFSLYHYYQYLSTKWATTINKLLPNFSMLKYLPNNTWNGHSLLPNNTIKWKLKPPIWITCMHACMTKHSHWYCTWWNWILGVWWSLKNKTVLKYWNTINNRSFIQLVNRLWSWQHHNIVELISTCYCMCIYSWNWTHAEQVNS